MDNNLTILMLSCDKYTDLLEHWSIIFKKYWPDCKYDIALITETEPVKNENYIFTKTFAYGKEISWVDRLYATISQIDTPYVLPFLADFFICDNFTNDKMEQLINIVKAENAKLLSLKPGIKPKVKINDLYGEMTKGQPYRINAQVGIWEKQYFLELLSGLKGKEAWDFERIGSVNSENLDGRCLVTYSLAIPYIELICLGKWINSALPFLKKEKMDSVKKLRDTESKWYLLYRNLRGVLFKICPSMITKIKLSLQKGNKE